MRRAHFRHPDTGNYHADSFQPQKGAKRMRITHFIRMFALVCAVLALSVPLLSRSAQRAAACSNPGCTVTATTPAEIDSYVSPLSVTSVTATFLERATTAQTQAFSMTGTLAFTVMDARGNNQGFVASITSSNFTSSLFPLLPISNTAILVSGTPNVVSVCYGPYSCGQPRGVNTSVGANMSANPAVAAECPSASIGEGQYAVTVPLALGVSGLTAEKLGSYPTSWSGTFTVSVTEGQPASTFTAYSCT
jgi:hypothetical protein